MHVSMVNGVLLTIVMLGWGVLGCCCSREARRSARFTARWAALAAELRDLGAELVRAQVSEAAREWRYP